jgi:SAM-dependent methyltransferase/transcriptional regulator with XRE-family HTH domain
MEAERANREQVVRFGGDLRGGRIRRGLTQRDLGGKVGLSQSAVSRVERGRGGGLTVDALQRMALALDLRLRLSLARDPLNETRDAGHLAMQELVLRLARPAGFTGSFELPTRPSEPWRSIDVCLADPRRRRRIVVECWNTIGDIGAAVRSSTRKRAELQDLAIGGGDRDASTGLVWVVRASARNRALVASTRKSSRGPFRGRRVAGSRRSPEAARRRTRPAWSGRMSPAHGSSPGGAASASLPRMNHDDHVRLIRAGVDGGGRRWLELGAGEGAFTLALADLLGPGAAIVALDRDGGALRRLADDLPRRFPGVGLTTRVGDFRDDLPDGPFDGVLAANSLHFVTDPASVLRRAVDRLAPGGRLVVVEYDADRGNPWVPHPFSANRFPAIAAAAGLSDAREIGRVPSRFLGAIYAAVAEAPAGLVHSRPHGDDREE